MWKFWKKQDGGQPLTARSPNAVLVMSINRNDDVIAHIILPEFEGMEHEQQVAQQLASMIFMLNDGKQRLMPIIRNAVAQCCPPAMVDYIGEVTSRLLPRGKNKDALVVSPNQAFPQRTQKTND